ALGAGEEVKLGFLLGTRKLNLFADHIPVGTTLAATAHLSTQDPSGMGVFDCELHWIDAPDDVRGMLPQDGLLAQAALNVYSPKDGKVV
ncbi:MAG: thioester dehydrase, partial [Kingella oralis]